MNVKEIVCVNGRALVISLSSSGMTMVVVVVIWKDMTGLLTPCFMTLRDRILVMAMARLAVAVRNVVVVLVVIKVASYRLVALLISVRGNNKIMVLACLASSSLGAQSSFSTLHIEGVRQNRFISVTMASVAPCVVWLLGPAQK